MILIKFFIIRNLGTLKKYVKNKYINNKCSIGALTFCSMYLSGIETRFNRGEINEDRFENQAQGCIPYSHSKVDHLVVDNISNIQRKS